MTQARKHDKSSDESRSRAPSAKSSDLEVVASIESEAGPKYPGIPQAMDGSSAVVAVETAASEAAGAYPITPSTQMGEGWAEAVAKGKTNVNGRRLIFFEPEGEHAAAAVTAGMSLVGLRSANFSSGQGVAYMHESLYAAVGKRLTYVLNMAARAITKQALNIHCGHDDYHAVDDTGFFQLFAKNVQEVADLNLIAHRIAELSLNPGICAQDGFLTSHVLESLRLPEPGLVKEFLGDPSDLIDSPTPAQRLVFGEQRRRIPELFDLDNPAILGPVQNQDSYAQGVAAQRPFYFDHIVELADQAFAEFAALTGRQYGRAEAYRVDDADYVIVGQGSVVENAEAVCDYLRSSRDIKAGVLNLTMFRPFPADLVSRWLSGKRGVVVLERVDQPLAVDAPLLRELRAALSKAAENGRATNGDLPYPGLPAIRAEEVPDFYSGCYGLGSRDTQPSDLIAAVEEMLPGERGRRHFYLGIDFVRKQPGSSELPGWQQEISKAYPHLTDLALERSETVNLLPESALALRIHSVGGWGAITMGKSISLTLFELLGLYIKSNPKYGSEKKGQPTTFYGVFAHERVRMNCALLEVDIVLAPDPNVFKHSDPLAGLCQGGVFIIQSSEGPAALWQSLPAWARERIRKDKLRIFCVDGFGIANAEASDADLRFRMQGAAFQGAFFKASPVLERENLTGEQLFEGIKEQLQKAFGHRGPRVVEDNLRVIRRGFDEVREVDWSSLEDGPADEAEAHRMPVSLQGVHSEWAISDPQRFFDQVCALYSAGSDPVADPFAALSAIPAATGLFRDMTDIRMEVPGFIAEKCTGCGQCWIQCPDAAIPGLVSEIDDILTAAVDLASADGDLVYVRRLLGPLAKQVRERIDTEPFTTFADLLRKAYARVALEYPLSAEQRDLLDDEFGQLISVLADFPLAKTSPFYTVPESKEKGSGGLLSITVNPNACKGCNLCVEVCPDDALVTVRQEPEVAERLKRNWDLWEQLPDTHDRFVNVRDVNRGIGVLHTALLKRENYRSMVGGDGACSGCGEKTAIHLITSAVELTMQERVGAFLNRINGLVSKLEEKVGGVLVSDANLGKMAPDPTVHLDVALSDENRARLDRLLRLIRDLKDLAWRYTSGPSGKGRAALGMTNATGCSSVWGSTYPFNPYPFPWVNHLFQDAPSIAIGIFDGHMRKMGDAFRTVREAELELEDAYDPKVHEPFFTAFDWREFSDEEFLLCPPIFAVGGDGAMLDIGFQNLSRLLASGKPVRVIVLDTQVYSNTGGQACTSGFTGQVSDMAGYGAGQHGKEETRKELSLLAIAHRTAYVLQTSQASHSHLLSGVLRGLASRRPVVFNIYTPCQTEHGIPDEGSMRAARMSLESRAFPFLTYDPDGGPSLADRIDLTGNPALKDRWPTYELSYTDEKGAPATMSLPVTIADWAAAEARFARHFTETDPASWTDDMMPFHEYLELSEEERAERVPFIYSLDDKNRLGRLLVSAEIVELTEERLGLWSDLKEMAGIELSPKAREAAVGDVKREYEQRIAELKAEYEAGIASKGADDARVVVNRIVGRLFGEGAAAGAPPAAEAGVASPEPAAAREPAAEAVAAPSPPSEAAAAVEQDAGPLPSDPFIDSALCTTCNECTNINARMFAYNADKQAEIQDPRAGTFQELVRAAELCPPAIIHPGTPLDPNEPDLEQWVERAKPFN
jgi:pyruvate-ferredoxin/flavodoxin oxidoreductase